MANKKKKSTEMPFSAALLKRASERQSQVMAQTREFLLVSPPESSYTEEVHACDICEAKLVPRIVWVCEVCDEFKE